MPTQARDALAEMIRVEYGLNESMVAYMRRPDVKVVWMDNQGQYMMAEKTIFFNPRESIWPTIPMGGIDFSHLEADWIYGWRKLVPPPLRRYVALRKPK